MNIERTESGRPTELPKTLQEWFNIAWEHSKIHSPAVKMNFDGTISCLYRTPGDNCCLIGAGLPDKYYRPSLENQSAKSAIRQLDLGTSDDLLEYLRQLQRVHDVLVGTNDPTDRHPLNYFPAIRRRLMDFAESHGLTIPQETL